jgi:hypothetical protein
VLRDDGPMRPTTVAPAFGGARRFDVALVIGCAVAAVLTGCSAESDDADRPDAEGPTTTTADGAPDDVTPGAEPAGPTGTTPDASGSEATSPPTESLASIPEVGVPGLDSDEIVCRAWSRFGGSFQVVAVAANFGSGDPVAVAALEVIASPTVTAAYDDLVANWPVELADEAEVVADEYLGPFARRADQALAALAAAGADATAMATIVAAWETALAGRDPEQAEIVVELPDDVRAVVDEAAAELASQLVPIPSDPTLITGVEVPLTDQFLFDNCPDRGTLGGIEG